MGRRGLNDIAWQYCTMVDGNHNHVCCNYCGHIMWGGVSHLKEHLAQKRGDVIACNMCPSDVITQMQEHLIELSHVQEKEERRRKETLEDMKRTEVQNHQDHQPQGPEHGRYTEEIDEEERFILEQAIRESLRMHEIEKCRINVTDDHEFEVARQESLRSYQLELRRRGEGSSASMAGPSHHYGEFDPEIDYDSELSF